MSGPIQERPRGDGTDEPLVLAVREAMEMLENMAIGGIGDGGPTIDELDEHVEKTGQSYDNNSDYHTAQWTWRKLQQGLNSQNIGVRVGEPVPSQHGSALNGGAK